MDMGLDTASDSSTSNTAAAFDFAQYKDFYSSFPESLDNILRACPPFVNSLSPQGQKDLALHALTDLLIRSRNELKLAKLLDRTSACLPHHDEAEPVLARVVRDAGSIGAADSWLLKNILDPVMRLKAVWMCKVGECRSLVDRTESAEKRAAEVEEQLRKAYLAMTLLNESIMEGKKEIAELKLANQCLSRSFEEHAEELMVLRALRGDDIVPEGPLRSDSGDRRSFDTVMQESSAIVAMLQSRLDQLVENDGGRLCGTDRSGSIDNSQALIHVPDIDERIDNDTPAGDDEQFRAMLQCPEMQDLGELELSSDW